MSQSASQLGEGKRNVSVDEAEKIIGKVMKRDGAIVDFNIDNIANAIFSAMKETEEGSKSAAEKVAKRVLTELVRIKERYATFVPSVEGIQDHVEKALMRADFPQTAKAYILYREKRSQEREQKTYVVPEEVKQAVAESSQYFGSSYQEFIFYRTYSRWRDDLGRRETWTEAIDRYMDFMRENVGNKITESEYKEVRQAMLDMEIMPSMRLLWSSGKAARESNVWAYNCSYLAPTRLRDFPEMMYILMCGAGLGYSVETENIGQLPQIIKQTGEQLETHVVADNKEGWADAFLHGLETWYAGKDIEFDYSKVRPKGARLKTAGGTASGPQPLKNLMAFSREKILARQGKRLSTIDVHDIICKIGEIVVSGGVRRSALISLSDLGDEDMRDAKKGRFFDTEPQRAMANNSAVYEEKPSPGTFLSEWTALVKSNSGERGIFNRGGLEEQLPERRAKIFREKEENGDMSFRPGVNPCGEIILQSRQFCNLTNVVIRKGDTVKELKRRMRLASLLGTYQATLTKFKYLSEEWKQNCDQERLLGVAFTGYYDNEAVRDDKVMEELKNEAVAANDKYAERLGISKSTCVTTVKPSGNSSQLTDTASGMHPRYAPYYIRRVRISDTDPLFKLMKEEGVSYQPEVGQTEDTANTFVLEFPLKAPEGAITTKDVSALDLLKEWRRVKEHYTEHNPSITISVGDDEWIEVANFLYKNWETVGGLSFLPRTDHVYDLAPYEPISKEEYEEMVSQVPDVDFAKLSAIEATDNTEGSKEFACVSGECPI
ncbi:MAG: ATP cone domain-containing protein [Candidatus Paceibacterota bacterium]